MVDDVYLNGKLAVQNGKLVSDVASGVELKFD